MSENDSLFPLAVLKEKDLSEQHKNILNTFFRGLPLATPDIAAGIAYEFDYCCPPLENEEETERYLWAIWEVMMNIAGSTEATSQIHVSLVKILEELRLFAKGDINVYRVSISRSTLFLHLQTSDSSVFQGQRRL